MNPGLLRAQRLLNLRRFDLAERELLSTLADDPDLADAHAMLAICLSERKDFPAAIAEAKAAVHLAPNRPYPYRAMALVYLDRNQFAEAEQAMREAIRFDPQDASSFGVLASIQISWHRWTKGLEAADQGLAVDPRNQHCLNMRARALLELGETEKAKIAAQDALEIDPENAHSHRNLGKANIFRGNRRIGQTHIREARRLSPDQFGRLSGAAAELKSQSWVYRIILPCLSGMDNARAWIFVSMGTGGCLKTLAILYVLVLSAVGVITMARHVQMRPDTPAMITLPAGLVVGMAILTLKVTPVYLLVVGVTPIGRDVLSRQLVALSAIASLFSLAATILLAWYASTGSLVAGAAGAACWIGGFPAATIYQCRRGWPRIALMCISLGVTMAALMAIAWIFLVSDSKMAPVTPFLLFVLCVAYWTAVIQLQDA